MNLDSFKEMKNKGFASKKDYEEQFQIRVKLNCFCYHTL